ncbi:hypothetical protein, partial [Tepidibacillus decaturensis]|uniref:hypothetical protein n=1 Tax=Tepidibacillus decaturensis TaxID=1413211 RepID=UPI001F2445B2
LKNTTKRDLFQWNTNFIFSSYLQTILLVKDEKWIVGVRDLQAQLNVLNGQVTPLKMKTIQNDFTSIKPKGGLWIYFIKTSYLYFIIYP